MDDMAHDALRQWEKLPTSQEGIERRISRERLADLNVGENIDRSCSLLGKTVDTKLMLPSAQLSLISDVYTYKTFVTDVPGDGDCGYHAVRRAALPYESRTATESQYPRNALECRQHLIAFLRRERRNIEAALVNEILEKQPDRHAAAVASHIIWRDVGFEPRDGSQPLFEEYCAAVAQSELSGKWMGSLLGEVELHLLARSFGVMAFCVRAAKKDGSIVLRHEGAPFLFLWRHNMSSHPRGAVVIRFTGNFAKGHFQIVNCGMPKKDLDLIVHSRKQKITSQPPRTRKGLKTEEMVRGDVQAVRKMRGVQLQTARRYKANLRLIGVAFQNLKERGFDPLHLESSGREVLDTIMSLIMQRCGPKSEGYEGLSARSTGGSLLSAVGMWYKSKGFYLSTGTCIVKGDSVQGPPWKSDEVLRFKSVLQKQQAKARSNPIKRAYQLTHDDVA